MNDSPKPDSTEKSIRFGCGFLFGGITAFLVVASGSAAVAGTFWMLIAGAAILCGLLALRYGDRFWSGITDWFHC